MALTYNQPRFTQNLLAKYKKCAPSFTINLYDDHWTLNKGPSKFLYTQPVSGLLEDVRALRIPVDFIEIFDAAGVPYYDGCMIVESIDHRKPRILHQQTASKEPECLRVVLQPNAESFYADLCLLNARTGNKWTDQEALEAESKILNAICPPLCLEPDVNLTRIVNTVIRASTPLESVLSKRKQVHEPEEDENDKAKRSKLWSQYMHPHNGKASSQTKNKRSMFDILHEVAQKNEKGVYSPKWKPPKSEPAATFQNGQPQNNQTFAPPNAVNPIAASSSAMSTVQPVQDPKAKAKVGKKTDVQEKKKMTSNVPAPAPSPIPEQRKAGSVAPGVSRTPVDPNTGVAGSPKPPPQLTQLPQPSKGVLKKTDEQAAQPQAQQPQPPQQANHMDQSHPTSWQPPIPPTQYLSQPPQTKKKPPAQPPQQASPFHSHTPIPGFANGNGFPQNPGYKHPANMTQNPNLNPNRGSPMANNQPLLSRSPLPPHSQSPHPQPQQPQQAAPPGQQHQVPQHASHQFNLHLPQNRFNPAMQGQPGHHPHVVPPGQHPVPQQHHQNAARPGQPPQHDPSQAMMHAAQMQHYTVMQQFPYQQMQMQGMMNGHGMRIPTMPGGQGTGGQYMPAPGWRVPAAGRGAGPPMTTMPMGMPHGQAFQHQQMMAAMGRGQAQQAQPQGQGR